MSKAKQISRRVAASRRLEAGRDLAQAKMSLDIVTGAQNLATLSPAELFDRERPEDLQSMFKLARNWQKQSWFVDQVNKLKLAFYHYGCRIVPARPADKKKLDEWMDKDDNRREALWRYIASVWGEWFLLDNVVSFWRREKEVTPFLLQPELCHYTDAMGLERLKVNLMYRREMFTDDKGQPLPDWSWEEIKRYTSQQAILLSEEFDEYFRVLTRAMRGTGFCPPRLYSLFRTLSQAESMEVGESMLAYAGRLVLRAHSLGFEVRSASNSAKQAEYLWKAARAKPIEDFFKGRQGFAEFTKQFDHKVEYIWVDPKHYEARKWETIVNRCMWWAGPVGFMLMAKQLQPFLLPMLRADALADRARVGSHLEVVLNSEDGWRLPCKVKVKWGDRCFNDLRLAWDMTKALMQQGPVSLTSALEVADFDPEQEAERKKEEAKPERDDELLPRFDPNHNSKPNQDGLRDKAGRPAGKPDPRAEPNSQVEPAEHTEVLRWSNGKVAV